MHNISQLGLETNLLITFNCCFNEKLYKSVLFLSAKIFLEKDLILDGESSKAFDIPLTRNQEV